MCVIDFAFTLIENYLSFTESGITILPEPEAVTGGAAQAWFSTDKNCVLHYFIAVAGLAKKGETVRAFLAGEMEDWHRNSNDAVQMVMVSNFINDAVSFVKYIQ